MADVNLETAINLYESGMSQYEVAESMGTTQKVITNLFKRNEYKARTAAKRNQFGDKNHMWKGNLATKHAFHRRLYSRFGKPGHCEICGTSETTRHYDYANISGNYHKATDYAPMCRSCHWKFDDTKKNFKGAVGGRTAKGVQNAGI
jgi:predicted transcriptional regulator